MNDDERDALLEELRPEHLSIAQRVFTPQRKIKAGIFAAVCVAGGLALDRFGVNGQPVIRGLFLASPVMAAAVLAFLRHAWGQNYIPSLATDLATTEPADMDDLASEPVQRVASPTGQPAVTVTVLPLPVEWRPNELQSRGDHPWLVSGAQSPEPSAMRRAARSALPRSSGGPDGDD